MRPNYRHMDRCTVCENFAPVCCNTDTYIKCIDCCESKIPWEVSPLERLAWAAMEDAE